MTVLNFPAVPSNGDVYVANGISYVYNDNAWTSNSAESNTELFVNVIGDNMTGNLTLGGDKVSLNATSGSATFASNVSGRVFIGQTEDDSFGTFVSRNLAGTNTAAIYQNGSASFGSGGVTIDSTFGGINFATAGNQTIRAVHSNALGESRMFFTNDDVSNITLSSNGSGEFAGDISIGSNPASSGSGGGLFLQADSGGQPGIYVYAITASSTIPVFQGKAGTGDGTAKSVTSQINTDGSATFTGNVTLPGGGAAAQALQKQEIEGLINNAAYVEKTGDTMTGQLTLPGGGSAAAAIQKQEVQSLISAIDFTPYVEKAGSTMTGTLTVPDVTVTGVINNSSIIKAWATCDTSGATQGQGTVFPHTGINVASCVKSDNLGRYEINFSTAMSSANYAVTTSNSAVNTIGQILDKTTSGFIIQHSLASGNQLVPINVSSFDVMVCGL